jgi:hypothetical protein
MQDPKKSPAPSTNKEEAPFHEGQDDERVKDRQKRTIGAQFPEHAQETGEYPRQSKDD